ncbi:hypothetical protein SAY86_022666 [Trapa natans]|uniref:CCT domain-containing protein n=1 Tax=Trapa natans TaxID=22666 RepID=A0AAN7M956_TRANT|nr:hypothetical protein SAY86_022666 [Trapa natans]
MYLDARLMVFPRFDNPPQEVQPLEEFCKSQTPNAYARELAQSSTITAYDLGGEGDLFKAPEPVTEEPMLELDPLAVAISMMSFSEDSILVQDLDITSLQNQPLMSSEVFYESHEDLVEKATSGTTVSEALGSNILPLRMDESLNCVTLSNGNAGGCNGDINLIHSPLERHLGFLSDCISEGRKEKLSRYRDKRTRRNFSRNIKYACRKALADSQPRIRGRFAKCKELNVSKNQ